MSITYKVASSGKIQVFLNKKRSSALLEEIPVAPAARKGLRNAMAESVKHRPTAAAVIFGRKWVPADINEVGKLAKAMQQVFNDSPKLLALIYPLINQGHLSAKPEQTLVRRLKDLLMRVDARFKQTTNTWGHVTTAYARKRPTDTDHFWKSRSDRDAPLTEAGWRYLTRLPIATLREIGNEPWRLCDKLRILNDCAALHSA